MEPLYGINLIFCNMNEVKCVRRKFLNFATFILKIDHSKQDFLPVVYRLGLNISVKMRF
jgi:hypothetical protein